ncbi:hypothetical protein AN3858.2 [Aspergillus nidulans FGSC A4]|nr:hypothetical protein AN3858.2 [Aspergillus nidulans FGSC A4]|eukprot:XP_661462.1 hypothetical protein AN3858.2 [Aspergillus nidulans FGSC A4]
MKYLVALVAALGLCVSADIPDTMAVSCGAQGSSKGLPAITISGAVFEVMVRAAFTFVRKLENAVGKLVKRFLRIVTIWPRPRPGVVRREIAISLGV